MRPWTSSNLPPSAGSAIGDQKSSGPVGTALAATTAGEAGLSLADGEMVVGAADAADGPLVGDGGEDGGGCRPGQR